MTARVTVVGSANLDLVATAARLPGPGETVLGHGFTTACGGKGANQAVAAARAGARCRFVGAVGDDSFGAQLRAHLAGAGVDVTQLRTVSGPSGVALIAVDDAAENLIVVAPGANATLTSLTGPDRAAVTTADVLLCQREVPLAAVTEAAVAGRQAGTVVILNAAPAGPLPAELLAAVDVLVVNEHEAAAVAGSVADSVDEAALFGALLARVPRVVLTLGARGARYADRDGTRLAVPAPRIEAVDTTAAGDAFTGALAVAWAQDRPALDAVRWACAAGAVCAQRPGAGPALPDRAQIDAMFQRSYGSA